jgi:hypothetical protein
VGEAFVTLCNPLCSVRWNLLSVRFQKIDLYVPDTTSAALCQLADCNDCSQKLTSPISRSMDATEVQQILQAIVLD